MSQPEFDPRRFRSTVPFYARYRLSYPDLLIERVIALAGLTPGDAVMDLGCGPGLLAIPFARAGMRVAAVDPEPDMLAAARDGARAAGVAMEFRQASSFDLPTDIGPFRLVTMGRSFHWMDRAETLKALDRRILPGGAIALFADDHPRTAENVWLNVLRDVGERYGMQQAGHRLAARRDDYRTHVSHLFDSPFSRIESAGAFVRRAIATDEIVGRALSLSMLSPEKLGEKTKAFETDLREALATLSAEGRFTEIAEISAIVARRA